MKKFAIFLICFAILCALCACGEVEPQANASNEPTPPSGEPTETVSGEPVVSTAPDTSAEPTVEVSDEPSVEPSAPPAVVLQALDVYETNAWGDGMREFVRRQTEPWHELVNTVTVTKFRQGSYIVAYGNTLRFYEFGYSMTPRDENAEPPYGWRLTAGKLYRDDNEKRYVVMYDLPDGEYIPICEITAQQIEEVYSDPWTVAKYGDTETAALVTIYDMLIAGTELEAGNWWADYLEWLEHDGDRMTVADADGNDISEEITTLFAQANTMFGEGNHDMFIKTNDPEGEYMSGFERIYGYEEAVDAVFTARGRAQLQGTTEGFYLPLYRFRGDLTWKRESWYSGMDLTFSLAETETLSVTSDRIEMRIPYDVVMTYDENGEPSTTERRWVDFAVAKTDDGWRVDNYPCPHAGVMEYDYESGDDVCTPLFFASEADEIYYRPHTGRLYVKNPNWLRDDFGGASLEIEIRIDGALTCVELWLDGGELGMARFTVNRDGVGEVLESEGFDVENAPELDDALMIEIARTFGGITECAEGYVSALDGIDAENLQNLLAGARDYREYNLELYDGDGRDISDEIIDLWIIGNHIYSGAVFDYVDAGYIGEGEAQIANFDEVADAFYTDAGEAQLREAQFSTNGNFFFERDGGIWDLRPGARMTWGVPDNIVGASVVERADTRIALDMTYDMAWYDEEPDYSTLRFVVEKEGAVWKIADYDPPMAWMPSREATITVADGVEDTAADEYMFGFAQAIARIASLDHAIEEYGCRITEVVVKGIEEGPSMAVAEGGRYVLMRVLLRMKPDRLPDADLGEYIEVEDGWITRDVDGDWYMAYYQSASGRWYAFSRTTDSYIDEYFGEAEDIAAHGDAYTAIMNAYYKGSFDSVLREIAEAEPDAVELK